MQRMTIQLEPSQNKLLCIKVPLSKTKRLKYPNYTPFYPSSNSIKNSLPRKQVVLLIPAGSSTVSVNGTKQPLSHYPWGIQDS